MKKTVTSFLKDKKEGKKIAMLTCYDYSTAKLMDAAGIDIVLVGDSVGQVVLGYDDTISVTVEDMIHHSAAVSRGYKNGFLLVDMPFMSYQVSVEEAMRNAGRIMKEGHANGVKLEGGERTCPQIRAITEAGIPVCAHLGLTPQSVHAVGGYKVNGRTEEQAEQLLREAKMVEEAGAFMLVLECVPRELAELISKELTIPTIGIGAGAGTDGQVLVYQDMLGMFDDFVPKFVKHFSNVGEVMTNAFREYKTEVENMAFPEEKHGYTIDEEVLNRLY